MRTSDEIGTTTTTEYQQQRRNAYHQYLTFTERLLQTHKRNHQNFEIFLRKRNTKNTGMKVKAKRCKMEKQRSKFKENNTGTKSSLNMH